MGRPRTWTPETICASIRHFVATEQRVPTWHEFRDTMHGLPVPRTIRQYFRDEAEAIRVAGFEPVPVLTKPRASHAWRRSIPRRKNE